jgi:hypothetical protein
MVAIKETSPEGAAVPVFAFTVIFAATFSFWPCVIPVVGDSESVVVVGTVETLDQFVARLKAFTDPRPVAIS